MLDLYGIVYELEAMGFYDIILPFLLIFAIVFGILQKITLFKDRNVNLIISIVIGLLVITQFEIVARMNLFLPKMAFYIVIVIMFLFLIGMFSKDDYKGLAGAWLFLAIIASFFAIYWALSPSLGFSYYEIVPYWMQDIKWSGLIALILIIVVIAIVYKGGPNSKFDKFMEDIRGGPHTGTGGGRP